MCTIVRKKCVSIMVIAFFVGAMTGCEYAHQHPGETTGAGVGAAGGAALGLLLGGSARAAIAGGLLGAIAGGVVGHYTSNQDKSLQQTSQSYNYQPSQGTIVSIERNSAVPDVVRPGQTVNLSTTYALLTPGPNDQVNITEERKITHNGNLVGNPIVTVTRLGGTYSASLPLKLPQTAEKGEYKVVTRITTANASDTRETFFRVD